MNNKKFNLIAGLVESTASTGLPDINPWGDGSQLSYLKFDGSLYDTQRNTNIGWTGTPCYTRNNPDGSGSAISAHTNKDTYSTSFIPNSLSSSGWSFSFWYNPNACNVFGSTTASNQWFIAYAPLNLIIGFDYQRVCVGWDRSLYACSDYIWTSRVYHHVVVQGNSSRLYVYTNGNLTGQTSSMSYSNKGSSRNLFRHWLTNTPYWPEQGTVSNLRTFTRMLTTDEITQLSQQY